MIGLETVDAFEVFELVLAPIVDYHHISMRTPGTDLTSCLGSFQLSLVGFSIVF